MVAYGWLLSSLYLTRVANDRESGKVGGPQRETRAPGGHLLERDFHQSGCSECLRRRDRGDGKVLSR
jgi:hypothetical protein